MSRTGILASFKGANIMQLSPQEWSHFVSTAAGVILGSTPPATAVILYIYKATRKLDLFLVEHEMLMQDYAFRAGKKLYDLPTRSGRFRHP